MVRPLRRKLSGKNASKCRMNLGGGVGKKNAPGRYGWWHDFLHQYAVQQRHQPPGRRDERHLGAGRGKCRKMRNGESAARRERMLREPEGRERIRKVKETLQWQQEREGNVGVCAWPPSRMLCGRRN